MTQKDSMIMSRFSDNGGREMTLVSSRVQRRIVCKGTMSSEEKAKDHASSSRIF